MSAINHAKGENTSSQHGLVVEQSAIVSIYNLLSDMDIDIGRDMDIDLNMHMNMKPKLLTKHNHDGFPSQIKIKDFPSVSHELTIFLSLGIHLQNSIM